MKRHIGGKQLQHLLDFDLNAFLVKHLRLEEVNQERLGWLITDGGMKLKPPTFVRFWTPEIKEADRERFRRAAMLISQVGAFGDYWTDDNWKYVEQMWRASPAHIRGQLRLLSEREEEESHGQRSVPGRRIPLTRYRMEQCFSPMFPR